MLCYVNDYFNQNVQLKEFFESNDIKLIFHPKNVTPSMFIFHAKICSMSGRRAKKHIFPTLKLGNSNDFLVAPYFGRELT